jgi:hypothetical protein
MFQFVFEEMSRSLEKLGKCDKVQIGNGNNKFKESCWFHKGGVNNPVLHLSRGEGAALQILINFEFST